MWGATEGRDPNPFFDSDWYVQQYADVATANLNPLSHYILYGALEGRNPSAHFDAQAYALQQLSGNPIHANPLSHFIQRGWGLAKRNAAGSQDHHKRHPIPISTLTKYDVIAPSMLDLTTPTYPIAMPTISEEFIGAGQSAWDAHGSRRLFQLLASTDRLDVTQVSHPEISIVLVLYNRAYLTLLCLESIINNADAAYEVIIVDNNSIDDTSHLLEHLDGARIVRNAANMGFGAACMQAARLARGEYLCFLNNDALLMPGSLSAAINNFYRDPTVGAVGGKILFCDGTLQEAGSILWSDASAWGFGRYADPNMPEFNFRRPVDYCSGAFLVTRSKLFNKIGGFDSIYQPAYYEDTDYCASLWSSGYMVVYEPRAVVAHYESASFINPSRAKDLIAKNRKVFAAKWGNLLRGQYFQLSGNILSARVSVRAPGKRILYVTDYIIDPEIGSGEAHAVHVVNGLATLGHQVTCITQERYASLSSIFLPEVEVRDGELCDQLLFESWHHYDVVWCTQPAAVRRLLQYGFHRCDSRPRIVYEIAGAGANCDVRHELANDLWDGADRLLADASDVVLVGSQAQADVLRRFGLSKVAVLSPSIASAFPVGRTEQARFLEVLADLIG
jgi:GT2 family glycosyltransferase